MADNPDAALVLFSGGQDSTVCLAWALQRFARVETVGFAYRQRHAVELAVRPRVRERLTALDGDWAARLGDDHVIALDALAEMSVAVRFAVANCLANAMGIAPDPVHKSRIAGTPGADHSVLCRAC